MIHFTLGAWLAFAQTSASPSADVLTSEVSRLAASKDNDDRFEAMTALLRDHHLTFRVETVTIDKQVGVEPRTTGRNIIVSVGQGSDEVVVGAHYDAIRLPDGTLSRGAVDNGAGAVVLLHVAEALQASPPPGRLTFVWFDMEELGLVGSTKYVEAHAADRIRAMINFDIDAYGDTILFSHPPGGENAPLRRAFLETCAREDFECVRFRSLPFSDDRPFGKVGVPTISVASLTATEMHQMWLLMNAGASGRLLPGTTPAIFGTVHTAGDVIGKVDARSMARVERLAAALLSTLSNWNSGR